jgi:hypothetical protein
MSPQAIVRCVRYDSNVTMCLTWLAKMEQVATWDETSYIVRVLEVGKLLVSSLALIENVLWFARLGHEGRGADGSIKR